MRFSWASSSQLIASSSAAIDILPPRPAGHVERQTVGTQKQLKRVRLSRRKRTQRSLSKFTSIKMAMKKAEVKKTVAKNQTNRVEYSFVYVGNIDSWITMERLESFFAPCGKVSRIQLRCSRGQAVTVGIAVPENVRTRRDRQYATVEFTDSQAARLALRLNGQFLDKCQLVVSLSPADLPEARDIVRARLGGLRERQGKPNPHTAKHRPIPIQRTEQIIESPLETPSDRHHIFGFSFAKCVA